MYAMASRRSFFFEVFFFFESGEITKHLLLAPLETVSFVSPRPMDPLCSPDVSMTGGMHYTPSQINICKFFNFQPTFSQLILRLKC